MHQSLFQTIRMCITFTKNENHTQNRENTEQRTHGRQPPLGVHRTKPPNKQEKKPQPGPHLKVETHAVMFIVLHGTCSVVPNTD